MSTTVHQHAVTLLEQLGQKKSYLSKLSIQCFVDFLFVSVCSKFHSHPLPRSDAIGYKSVTKLRLRPVRYNERGLGGCWFVWTTCHFSSTECKQSVVVLENWGVWHVWTQNPGTHFSNAHCLCSSLEPNIGAIAKDLHHNTKASWLELLPIFAWSQIWGEFE